MHCNLHQSIPRSIIQKQGAAFTLAHVIYPPPPNTHSNTQKHILSLISSIAHTASHSLHTDIQAIQTPYAYTDQLLELDRCRLQVPENLPTSLKHIQTPAITEVWEKELVGHPVPQFARYILQCLSQGFRIGFQHRSSRLQQAVGNMVVADPKVVSDYIGEELAAGRLVELAPDEATSLTLYTRMYNNCGNVNAHAFPCRNCR